MLGVKNNRRILSPLAWVLASLWIVAVLWGCGGKSSVGGDSGVTGDASTIADGDVEPDADNGFCGDGFLNAGEECDDGNGHDDDECLSDCTLACGDGVVNAVEICDTGITAGDPGACPTDCDDADACTTDTLSGTGCQAECVHGDITACADDDGCCPGGCDGATDNDCTAVCDNGVVEQGETCDPVSSCPTTCDDSNTCTTDVMTGAAATCDVECSNTPITGCTDGDGCCPTGCDDTNDNDCSATCGNGNLDPGETCDPPGDCPTTCDDTDACTVDLMTGAAATCNVDCSNTPITACADGDGCCPTGCFETTDNDCTPVCGNGVEETGEACDDGGTTPGDGCDANCQLESTVTVLRISDLDLMDPHIYADLPLVGCSDITNSVPFGLADPINTMLQDAVQADADGDGYLDMSFLAIFRPLDQSTPHTGVMDIAMGLCTDPMAGTVCDLEPSFTPQVTSYTNEDTATCLSVIPGTTTSSYTPAPNAPGPLCFHSASVLLSVDLGGIVIPLEEVQIGATYVGNPATGATTGLLRGFLAETEADQIILPTDIPVVGGDPLSSVLPGGTNCCGTGDDRDTGPDGTTIGWWFYFNFTADVVTYIGT